MNKIEKNILPNDKVLIVSPHPDDDVIGMGGTMSLLPNKQNVRVLYMTNGDGGLKSGYKGRRMVEALSAIKILGYQQENIIDGQLPFYKNTGRKVSSDDYDRFYEILNKFKPNHIFVCRDSDPNGTHEKCIDIVDQTLKRNHLPYLKIVWYYMGAWGQLGVKNPFAPNCHVTMDENVQLLKHLSIKMHLRNDLKNQSRPSSCWR